MTGFYEGKKPEKQPFYIQINDKHPFALAGLWDAGVDSESFTNITTAANALVVPLHDRMPVIIDRKDLGPMAGPEDRS